MTKRIIKKGLSNTIWLVKNFCNLTDKQNSFRILLYHSIGSVDIRDRWNMRIPPQLFRKQMEYLIKKSYNILTLGKLIEMVMEKEALPAKSIAITFDDGYKDNLTVAGPILKEFNFHATIFLPVDYIEGSFERKGECWQEWGFLNWDEINQLVEFGFEIGSHSAMHTKEYIIKGKVTSNLQKKSKDVLEKHIHEEVKLFSYPHGIVNNELKSSVKEAGFVCACSGFIGRNTFDTDLFELRRTEITNLDDIGEFQKKLNGSYDWLAYFQKRGKRKECLETRIS